MASKATDISLQGVSDRINGRHAFVHERVLELIARGTTEDGSISFRKGDLAVRLGCCDRSLDRALTRLRREGYIISEPSFDSGPRAGERPAWKQRSHAGELVERGERVGLRAQPNVQQKQSTSGRVQRARPVAVCIKVTE